MVVPAHTGGADLSFFLLISSCISCVPAHTGGADLSASVQELPKTGGYVPAHTGGADLSS